MTNEFETHDQEQVLVISEMVTELVTEDREPELVEVGLQGPPGPTGKPGPAGPGLRITGAVESSANLPVSGVDGDLIFAEDSKHGFAWIDGAWRDIGPIAIPGPAGKDGQIRYTGTGAPGVILGANPGDTYMDLATGNVYKLL